MIENNPLYSKENLKKMEKILSDASRTLVYRGNGLKEQVDAGKTLWHSCFIIVAIMDHIFDYFPCTYFLNDEQKKIYPSFFNQLKQNTKQVLNDAIESIVPGFQMLDTIEVDRVNIFFKPERKPQEEEAVLELMNSINENINEIERLLNGPKKVSDPNKPTAEEIKGLITKLSEADDFFWQMCTNSGDSDMAFQTHQYIDMFKFPLLFAWQGYKYGWHTDFCEEGDSMIPFHMFQMDIKGKTQQMIDSLKTDSLFNYVSQYSSIPSELIRVYTHFLDSIDNGSINFV